MARKTDSLKTDPRMKKRLPPLDREWLAALETTLSEWNSPEDDEAFRDL